MTDFYIDHGCALYPTAYMSVPTNSGSFPQEGDGKAYGGGTTPAVAVATMDFTGVTAAAGATFGVHGATLTCVASGASTVQFNAGSGSTLAANLVTAINAATAVPSVVTGNVTSPYLKGLVWASASGAVLTVYSRIASSDLNQATNASCTLICGATGNWTSPPATTNFSGGVSGPWASFFNVAALTAGISSGVSAAGTYGGVVATMMGAVVDGDKIHVRTKRSGSNITIAWPASSLTVTTRNKGTLAAPLFIIFDNGLKWSGDAGVFVMTADASASANRYFTMPGTNGLKQVWYGTKLTGTTCNWRIEAQNVPQTSNYNMRVGAINAAANFLDIEGLEVSGASGAYMNNTNSAYAYFTLQPPQTSSMPRDAMALAVRNCVVKQKGRRSVISSSGSSSAPTGVQYENCLFDHTGLSSAADEAIVNSSGYNAGVGDGKIFLFGCTFAGFPAAANLSGFNAFSGKRTQFRLQDCTFDNIKISGGTANGGLVGASEDVTNPNVDQLSSITVSSSIGIRPFAFENRRRSFSWFDSAAPTTTGSTLPDGTTTFSIRTAVTTETNNVTPWNPVKFPRMAKHNSLADGTRTATLRLLVDNNIKTALGSRDPYKSEMWIEVSYIGTDGALKFVTTRPLPTDSDTAISGGTSGDWSAVSYDVNGVTHNYTAYEISVSCPDVETLTEAGLVFCQGCQSSSVDNLVFLDPEWSLT